MNENEKKLAYRKSLSYWLYVVGTVALAFGSLFIQNVKRRGVIDVIAVLVYMYATHISDFTRRKKGIEIGLYVLLLIIVIVFEFFMDS